MTRRTIGEQARSTWPTLLVVAAVSTALIGVVLLLANWKDVPYGTLTRDPAAVADFPFYTGFLSNLGIFIWSATAAVCWFSAAVVRSRDGNERLRAFLAASGLVSLWLGLDDVFLIHESVAPVHFGIPENAVLAAYGLLLAAYLLIFFRTILDTDYVVFALALGLFATSVGLDFVDPPRVDPYLLEDGVKLVALVTWLAYFCRTGAYAVRGARALPPGVPARRAG